MLLWYFLKKQSQEHVHGSGEIKSYCYFGIAFADNGSWDSHVQKEVIIKPTGL